MAWYDYPLLATALTLGPIVIPYYVANNQSPDYAKGVMTGHLTAATVAFLLISAGVLDY